MYTVGAKYYSDVSQVMLLQSAGASRSFEAEALTLFSSIFRDLQGPLGLQRGKTLLQLRPHSYVGLRELGPAQQWSPPWNGIPLDAL